MAGTLPTHGSDSDLHNLLKIDSLIVSISLMTDSRDINISEISKNETRVKISWLTSIWTLADNSAGVCLVGWKLGIENKAWMQSQLQGL